MSRTEDIADELASQTMEIIDATGNDDIVNEVASALGGYSQTLEEAYLTAIRVRRAEQRARAILKTQRNAAGLQ
ncbi:MAG: hypothetical protein ABJI96_04495 [Paracoccaceae bacterium]